MSVKQAPAWRPTYRDFERTIEAGTGATLPVTEQFVRKVFERLRTMPMNAKIDGLAEAIMVEVVGDFAKLYHALAQLEPPYEQATFGAVIATPQHRMMPIQTDEFANGAVAEMLIAIERICDGTIGEGLFVYNDQEVAYHQAIRWKDLVELSRKAGIYKHFLNLDRELTILLRTYDLVSGLILRQQPGYAG